MRELLSSCLLVLSTLTAFGQGQYKNNPNANHGNAFEELGYLLPTPNEYRTASGAPGPKYWQQRADYDMDIELDEVRNMVYGKETVTYFNQSPDPLHYLWLQLDENIHHPDSDNNRDNTSRMREQMTDAELMNLEPHRKLQGYGFNILRVTDGAGRGLKYTIVKTMMRIDLPAPLQPGQRFVFKIDWNYKLNDKSQIGGRGGFEHFPEDGNNLYSITQFYPRMAVYSDFQGWQHLQFRGGAEFALNFGNFRMRITTPADHVVAAAGECRNLKDMITPAQFRRWQQSQTANEPIEIITLEEARVAERSKSTGKKTWIYEAQNVRDVAFNSSRKFIWDAMAVDIEGRKVMAMSYYPKEAYNLYRRYSTKATAHTLRVYSRHTIPYPYPVAISVEAANGMEYPMLAMNFGRTEKDGTYSEATKYGAIGVIIHEVGHNFFPMIVNSDERQWWWMDEGLNTFLQFLTEQEFDNNYPSRRGPAHLITSYMSLPREQLEPIMTKGDAVSQVGPNAYAKAATGLNILRETIVGRELFDFAFKQYAQRWAFKHPTPADLFRTLEDASGMDLDWFFRGWYFGTDPVDIALQKVEWYKLDVASNANLFRQQPFETITQRRYRDDSTQFYTDTDTTLRDFYYYNRQADEMMRQTDRDRRDAASVDTANLSRWADKHFYELTFSNEGGLIMPIIVEWTFTDGTKEVDRVPVTIWRLNEKQVTKVFIKDKQVASIRLDPYRETADINEENGVWPLRQMPSRFKLFKSRNQSARGASTGENAMQRAQREGAPRQ